jgi:L-rhamnose mutarotase
MKPPTSSQLAAGTDLQTNPLPRIRKAFVMAVSPGQAEEYARRHNPVWPELAAVLKAHGIHNYSIFYYPTTRQLFAYLEIEDETCWAEVGRTEIEQRWRKYMSEIMPTNPDFSPLSAVLTEMFHLD